MVSSTLVGHAFTGKPEYLFHRKELIALLLVTSFIAEPSSSQIDMSQSTDEQLRFAIEVYAEYFPAQQLTLFFSIRCGPIKLLGVVMGSPRAGCTLGLDRSRIYLDYFSYSPCESSRG